jgi:D-alanyl-D-alanine carboxypeptidase/D-alanyl-D-alanine-endopeptidase (penicillin-binding protein 4)
MIPATGWMKSAMRTLFAMAALSPLPMAMAGEPIPSPGFKESMAAAFHGGCASMDKSAVNVISMASGEVMYNLNADRPMIPASVQKLAVSSAALIHLGPAYSFKTRVAHTGERKGGVIRGDLYIKGMGDPKLTPERLFIIADNVRALGVTRVEGKLILDGSFFGWEDGAPGRNGKKTQRAYDAGLGALSVSFNTLAVRFFPGEAMGDPLAVSILPDPGFIRIVNKTVTGTPREKPAARRSESKDGETLTVTGGMAAGDEEETVYVNVEDPARMAAGVFIQYLRRAGVEIGDGWAERETPGNAAALYEHKSEPLALILRGLNKFSNNFTAEQVAMTMAAELDGPPATHQGAQKIIMEFLKDIGVPVQGVRLADASGLSRENRLTAVALARLLYIMGNRFDAGPDLVAAMGIMGVDGSLRKRGKGLPIVSAARAKTGSLDGVTSLAGYASGAGGKPYAFAIIINDPGCSFPQAARVEDKIIAVIHEKAP